MTQQILDRIAYNASIWRIEAMVGDRLWLFDPMEFGISLSPGPSSCWQGYLCTYAIQEGVLCLDRIDFIAGADLPPLFGRASEMLPPEARILGDFGMAYTHLSAPIAFTGGLLLGRERPEDLNPRWHVPGIWSSLYVAELLVDHGRITAALDHTPAFASLRDWIKAELFADRWSGPEVRARTNAITQKAYFED